MSQDGWPKHQLCLGCFGGHALHAWLRAVHGFVFSNACPKYQICKAVLGVQVCPGDRTSVKILKTYRCQNLRPQIHGSDAIATF